MYNSNYSLHDKDGQRKYLNQAERKQFYQASKKQKPAAKLFCQLLYFSGARIAEVHNLKTASIDISDKTIVFETLKKRRKGVFRTIPIPDQIFEDLENYLNGIESDEYKSKSLWEFSIRTGARVVKSVMNEAGITGVKASARGLRHGFAVHAIKIVPITVVSKLLGHADLETTAIYLDIIGEDERRLIKEIWSE